MAYRLFCAQFEIGRPADAIDAATMLAALEPDADGRLEAYLAGADDRRWAHLSLEAAADAYVVHAVNPADWGTTEGIGWAVGPADACAQAIAHVDGRNPRGSAGGGHQPGGGEHAHDHAPSAPLGRRRGRGHNSAADRRAAFDVEQCGRAGNRLR